MSLQHQLKELLIEELNLVDVDINEIADTDPLFGEGLGLDSLDAVEIVVLVKKHFSVEISNMDEGKKAFQSIHSLAEFIESKK